MRVEAERSGTEGCRALVEDEWVMPRRDTAEEGLGRETGISETVQGGWGRGRQVAQGIHSFAAITAPFLRLTLQMSCGNPSYKSQLKLTTKPVAVPSPSKLSLKTITAPPNSAKLSLTVMLDILLKRGQKNPITTFCNAESFWNFAQTSCHYQLGVFMSHVTSLITLSKQILIFRFEPIVRKS